MTEISKQTKNKIKRQTKKEIKSASKKMPAGGWIAIILTLIVAIAGGVVTEKIITKNDGFVLAGKKEYVIEVGATGSTYTYVEEGYEVISFGKNISDKVTIKTNMTKNNDGSYTIDTSEEGDYYLIYEVDSLKFGKIKRVRTFTVGADNE